MLRRHLLATLPLAGLAACSITTSGGTTTGTLDVDRIVTDASAILSACQGALLAPSLAVLLGANYIVAQTALAAGQATLAELRALAGPSVSVSIDTSKVQALVTSLLDDAQKVLGLVQGVAPMLPASLRTTVGNYTAGALALIPVVQVAAALSAIRATAPAMDEMTARRMALYGA